MKKRAVLALGVFVAACGEVPTEIPREADSSIGEALVIDLNQISSSVPLARSVVGNVSPACLDFTPASPYTVITTGALTATGSFFAGETLTIEVTDVLGATTFTGRVSDANGLIVEETKSIPGAISGTVRTDGVGTIRAQQDAGIAMHTFYCEPGGPLPVAIDIKPGSDPNSINIDADNAVVTVAILSTPDFDATTVDHTTLLFEGVPEIHVNKKTEEARRHEEDVNGDGLTDLLMHVRVGDTGFDESSTEGTLTGSTFDGRAIQGTDAVVPIWAIASATGSGHILEDELGRKRIFSFNAVEHSDGSVAGQFTITLEEVDLFPTENPSHTQAHYEVTCLAIDGNRAWVGGVVKSSTVPDWVGGESAWVVQDNGEGEPSPDLISLTNVPTQNAGYAQAYCDGRFGVPTLAVQAGNVQVR